MRPRLQRVRAALPAPGLGRARRRRDLGRHARGRAARRSRTPASAAPTSPAIGITNQRETVVAWDRDSGEPLHHALVWQDRRTAARCDELQRAGHEALFRERTGLVLDPYFSGTKIEWLAEARRASTRTPPSARSTRGSSASSPARHVTDYSNASRTLLFDIRKLAWDAELCELLGVPPASLPEPLPSAHVYGETERVRRQRPGGRHRRRPAGRALRPGLPRARARQEHLRHRLLRAREHGRRGAGRAEGC